MAGSVGEGSGAPADRPQPAVRRAEHAPGEQPDDQQRPGVGGCGGADERGEAHVAETEPTAGDPPDDQVEQTGQRRRPHGGAEQRWASPRRAAVRATPAAAIAAHASRVSCSGSQVVRASTAASMTPKVASTHHSGCWTVGTASQPIRAVAPETSAQPTTNPVLTRSAYRTLPALSAGSGNRATTSRPSRTLATTAPATTATPTPMLAVMPRTRPRPGRPPAAASAVGGAGVPKAPSAGGLSPG